MRIVMRVHMYFLLGLILNMCFQGNRGTRGGALRRITRLVTNRPDLNDRHSKSKSLARNLIDLTPCHSNRCIRPVYGDIHLESKQKQKSAVSENISQKCSKSPFVRKNLINVKCSEHVSKFENISIGLVNCQSLKNTTDHILDIIYDNRISMMFLTETWIQTNGDELHLKHATPNGYYSIHRSRSTRKRGGGIGINLQNSIKSVDKTAEFEAYTSFELLGIESKQNGLPIWY